MRPFRGLAGGVASYGIHNSEGEYYDNWDNIFGKDPDTNIATMVLWDTYRTLLPWDMSENTDYSVRQFENPYYRYTMSCSSSDDGEGGSSTSCELNEEEIKRDLYPLGVFTVEFDASYALPIANEIRPVNVAVKFMIKAK